MSNQVKTLVSKIDSGKYTDATKIFKRELSERILSGIQDRKAAISSNMLNKSKEQNNGG